MTRIIYICLTLAIILFNAGCVATKETAGIAVKDSTHIIKTGNFIWPLKGKIIYTFGAQKGDILNKGIDITAEKGKPIIAASGGKIIFSSDKIKGYGSIIIIDHDNSLTSTYAHNSQSLVKSGEVVKMGQTIAMAGNAGRAKLQQLHFEIRKDNIPQDPLDYLSR